MQKFDEADYAEQCKQPSRLKCEGCGLEKSFETAQQAFEEGWDGPPHFTVITCCPNCSAAEILVKRAEEGHGPQSRRPN